MAKEQRPSAAEHRAIVILAAGQGTRMGEEIDKALVDIAGIPMIEHVARNCAQIPRRQFVIVRGPDQDVLEFPGHDIEIAVQDPGSKGTAAA
ncbi:MAG: NTP transferase domain-containing protein, partial [Chloroflexi bacterium]|nr:NTP transferase domain-containing protein [Chloroflexota bacterium]